jgi:hypothetical protein
MKFHKFFNSGKYIPELTIIIAAIITLTIFYEVLPQSMKINESGDYFHRYKPSAERIYKSFDFKTEGLYVPGYPAIIASLFLFSNIFKTNVELMILIFQLICFCISAILIYKISNLFIEKTYAIIPAFIWITYPPNLYIMKQPGVPSIPFTTLILFILFLFTKIIYTKKFFTKKGFPNWLPFWDSNVKSIQEQLV